MDEMSCDAIVLCGGLGTRLKSISGDQPKVMMPYDGQPFMDLIIDYLIHQGVSRVILGTGYQSQMIEDHYRFYSEDINIDFSREDEPLGTGGALKQALQIVDSEHVFVVNGDSFCGADLKSFWRFHQQQASQASVVLTQDLERNDTGRVEIDDTKKILRFTEKSDPTVSPWINAGIYCFHRSIADHFPEKEKFSIELDLFSQDQTIQKWGFCVNDPCIDIGTPDRYQAALAILKRMESS